MPPQSHCCATLVCYGAHQAHGRVCFFNCIMILQQRSWSSLLLGRMSAYLADAAALARAQWTQFSPGAMLAGIGLFAGALLLHLRFAWAAATDGPTLQPAAATGLGQRAHAAPPACQAMRSMHRPHAAEAGHTAHVCSILTRACVMLIGMEWAALAAVLACGAAVFSANAVMAEGGFATAVLAMLTLALAFHRPPAPLVLQPTQTLQPGTHADPHPGPQHPNKNPMWGARGWPAAGVVLMATATAALGVVPRTPTDAMHKAAAAAPGAAWPRLAALAARACTPFPMLCPALFAGLRTLPCAAALAMLLRLQARFAQRDLCAAVAAAWTAGRLMRGAARGALVAAYACAALHLALADGLPTGQPRACAGPAPSPGLPAILLQLAASLRAAAAAALRLPASGSVDACQDWDIRLLLPQLVYSFSAAAAALCMCHACLADKRMTLAPLPGRDLLMLGFPSSTERPEPEPCHGNAAPGYLLSGVTAALVAPAMVVLGPGRMLAIALGLAECGCAWVIICGSSACRGTAGGLDRGRASAAGVLWALLGTQLFFCTGHFCEFAGLQTAAGALLCASCPCNRLMTHRALRKCMRLSCMPMYQAPACLCNKLLHVQVEVTQCAAEMHATVLHAHVPSSCMSMHQRTL